MQCGCLLGFMFFSLVGNVYGLTCHDCSGEDDCANLIGNTPELSGRCSLETGEGKCFIRRDSNDATYWGCLTDIFWPEVPWRSFNGCTDDWLHGWFVGERESRVKKPIVWCVCDSDLCNTNIADMLKDNDDQGEGSTPGSGPDACEVDRKSVCEQICEAKDNRAVCSCRKGFLLGADSSSCIDVNECDISNGGCDQECVNTLGSFYCLCGTGFRLDSDASLCIDINECQQGTSPCESNKLCVNTIGSYECQCTPGYEPRSPGSNDCLDRNECLDSALNDCEQSCINTAGSFQCSCSSGFELNIDERTCDDVNECQNSPCKQLCFNAYGSFRCSCRQGFMLQSDNTSCSDVNECILDLDNCQQICLNTAGSYQCGCRAGYQLNVDKKTCDDINECHEQNGGCSHLCHNFPGSFKCSCPSGLQLAGNVLDCEDMNECLDGNGGCDHECSNGFGSFVCKCRQGFHLNADGRSCNDYDNCASNEGRGDCQQICNEIDTGRECSCYHGYRLDRNGVNCTDVDECLQRPRRCEQFCNNTEGSYFCFCDVGFVLNPDDVSCSDLDECLVVQPCEHTCQNTFGSYECGCLPGFRLHANGSCIDIDECSEGSDGCSHYCINTPGSFTCLCSEGDDKVGDIDMLVLAEDGKTCLAQCPDDYIYSPVFKSCYKIHTPQVKEDALDRPAAEEACQSDHPSSHLATIIDMAELEMLGALLATQPAMLEGWQGWWLSPVFTTGVNQFLWQPGREHLPDESPFWSFRKFPPIGTCVWIMQIPYYNFTLGNFGCETQAGHVCEIDFARRSENSLG